MKFLVEIRLESGMHDNLDVAQALREIADSVSANGMPVIAQRGIMDLNGNTVGHYCLTAE